MSCDDPGVIPIVTKRRSTKILEKIKKVKDVIIQEYSFNTAGILQTVDSKYQPDDDYKAALSTAMFEAYNVLDHFLAIDVGYSDAITVIKMTNSDNRDKLADYLTKKYMTLLTNTKSSRTTLYALTYYYSDWFDNNVDAFRSSKNGNPIAIQHGFKDIAAVQFHINKMLTACKELKSILWEHHYRIKKYWGVEPTFEKVCITGLLRLQITPKDVIDRGTQAAEVLNVAGTSSNGSNTEVQDEDEIAALLSKFSFQGGRKRLHKKKKASVSKKQTSSKKQPTSVPKAKPAAVPKKPKTTSKKAL